MQSLLCHNIEATSDGEKMHHLFYEKGDLLNPKRWWLEGIEETIQLLISEIKRKIRCIADSSLVIDREINIIDYGAKTGFTSIEIIKKLEEEGILEDCHKLGIKFYLHLIDMPSNWFFKSHQLLGRFPFIIFHSLKDNPTGKILNISDIFEQEKIDIIVANLSFHVIPVHILPRIIQNFFLVLKNNGIFLWSSPDTPPVSPNTLLVHESSRRLRKCLLELVDNQEQEIRNVAKYLPKSKMNILEVIYQAISCINKEPSSEERIKAANIASKQILEAPTNLSQICDFLDHYFKGKLIFRTSVVTKKNLLDILLIPSNQRYFYEIKEEKIRVDFIKLLMKYYIFPQLSRACSPYFNLHWTIGNFVKEAGSLPGELG
ncbi:MAG: hypothetical protein IBJ00_00690 [Alphaproteobacteria bacterium]|nr:hypothetical protein [Alphaproteobacteria bacterium]